MCAGIIRRWLLNVVVALLFIANTINIAADLGAMADAAKLLVGGHAIVYVLFFGVTSVVAQIFLDYKRYVAVLKWLTLSLFAYVAALAFAHVSWGEALAGVADSETRPGAPITSPPSSRSSAPRSRPICSSGRPRRRPKSSGSIRASSR